MVRLIKLDKNIEQEDKYIRLIKNHKQLIIKQPNEIWTIILNFFKSLEYLDFLQLSQVNKHFNKILKEIINQFEKGNTYEFCMQHSYYNIYFYFKIDKENINHIFNRKKEITKSTKIINEYIESGYVDMDNFNKICYNDYTDMDFKRRKDILNEKLLSGKKYFCYFLFRYKYNENTIIRFKNTTWDKIPNEIRIDLKLKEYLENN